MEFADRRTAGRLLARQLQPLTDEQITRILQSQGINVEVIIPPSGSIYAPSAMMVNGYNTKQTDIAKLYMDYVLSADAQAMFAKFGARPILSVLGKLQLPADEYRQYEGGAVDIPVGVLYQIAHRFNVELTALLTGEEPRLHTYALTRSGREVLRAHALPPKESRTHTDRPRAAGGSVRLLAGCRGYASWR